jgi:hypothetical protein
MNKLINILGQQFYTANIDQIIEQCSQKEKCALVIDENYLVEFLSRSEEIVGKSVNQIIVISENLNTVFPLFEDEKVLLISAINIKEAMKVAVFGAELSNDVVCVSDQDASELKSVLKLIGEES